MVAETHVGDVGTLYRVKCEDQDGPFDPTAAVQKEIIFQMPQGAVVKPATVEQVGTDFFLLYEAEPGFHSTAGRIKLQGHVRSGDGKEFWSNIQTKDDAGNDLRVYSNIEVS